MVKYAKKTVNNKTRSYVDLEKQDSVFRIQTLHLTGRNSTRVQRRLGRFFKKKDIPDALIVEPRRTLLSVRGLKAVLKQSGLVNLKNPEKGNGDSGKGIWDVENKEAEGAQVNDSELAAEEIEVLESGVFMYPTFDAEQLMVYDKDEETESEKLISFVCYRSIDGKNVALDLHYCLKAERIDNFIDEKKLHGGIENDALLEKKINDSHIFFFILSPGTHTAKYQEWELKTFLDSKVVNDDKLLVPIHHRTEYDHAPDWYKKMVKKDVKFITTESENFYEEVKEAVSSFMDVFRI